jgi:AcrR family transcriptional regulator
MVVPMTTDTAAHHVGRPRGSATDATILQAVLTLIGEVGVAGVTVAEVARRAGVARATVYLRWPSRAALVGAATKAVAGGKPFELTGDLERDIRRGATFLETVVGAPYFNAIVPELIRAVLADPQEIAFDALAPNREGLAAEYWMLAAAQGFDPRIEPHLLFDLLFGTALAHVLATGAAPTPEDSRQIAEVVIAGLQHRGD